MPSARLFTAGDWIVIATYLFGIIGLGIWFGRDQRNTRDYFLGSRNIPWRGIGLSIVAAETSALTIIGVPAMAYGGDITFIQVIIGYVMPKFGWGILDLAKIVAALELPARIFGFF